MKSKTIFTYLCLLLISILGALYLIGNYIAKNYGFDDEVFGMNQVNNMITNFKFILILGTVIALLFSVIPKKLFEFLKKVKNRLIIGFNIAGMILLGTQIHYMTSTMVDIKLYDYSEINQSNEINCEEIKIGEFETSDYNITRKNNIQIHTNKRTNESLEYRIEWLNNCEYHLKANDSQKIIKVKVVENNKDHYVGYMANKNSAQKIIVNKKSDR